jgi:hypothetical protein
MLTAPKGYEPTKGPVFDGGSNEDRDAVLKLFYDYWLANDAFNGDALLKIWDHSDADIFFNTNGHSYHGVHDWLNIWRHYKKLQTTVEPLGLGDVRIMIRGDMAYIAADRILRWWADIKTGDKPARADVPYCRGTFVCVKNAGKWTTVHVHFSMGRSGARPDQGGTNDAHVEAHRVKR